MPAEWTGNFVYWCLGEQQQIAHRTCIYRVQLWFSCQRFEVHNTIDEHLNLSYLEINIVLAKQCPPSSGWFIQFQLYSLLDIVY